MVTKEVATVSQEIFALPDIDSLKQGLEQVRKFQAAVKELLIEGHDYGVIPGTDKPTLLKPGAEKIDKILKLADTYEELEKVEDWIKPFFFYKLKCRLIIMGTEVVVSEGMGSCNSMEGKYRYRFVFGSDVPDYIEKAKLPKVVRKSKKTGKEFTMYRIENEDIYTLANTILKMAKKRAHIDASLSAGRLSDVFTQDIEDIMGDITPGIQPETKASEEPKEPLKVEEVTPTTQEVKPTPPDKSPNEPTAREQDITMIRSSASKLGWSAKRLNQELLNRFSVKTLDGMAADAPSADKVHEIANKLADLAEVA